MCECSLGFEFNSTLSICTGEFGGVKGKGGRQWGEGGGGRQWGEGGGGRQWGEGGGGRQWGEGGRGRQGVGRGKEGCSPGCEENSTLSIFTHKFVLYTVPQA